MKQKKLIREDALCNVAEWPTEGSFDLQASVKGMRIFLAENSNGLIQDCRVEFDAATGKESRICLTIPIAACAIVGDRLIWLQNATAFYAILVGSSHSLMFQLEQVIENHKALRREFQRIENAHNAREILKEARALEGK